MAKFRTRPMIVEAVQWTGKEKIEGVRTILGHLWDAGIFGPYSIAPPRGSVD